MTSKHQAHAHNYVREQLAAHGPITVAALWQQYQDTYEEVTEGGLKAAVKDLSKNREIKRGLQDRTQWIALPSQTFPAGVQDRGFGALLGRAFTPKLKNQPTPVAPETVDIEEHKIPWALAKQIAAKVVEIEATLR